ncbi:MAG: hypothetical protein WDM92_15085 [Caulobacteraceae bacterium]
MSNPDLAEEIHRRMALSPQSRALGLELVTITPQVVLKVPYRADLVGRAGYRGDRRRGGDHPPGPRLRLGHGPRPDRADLHRHPGPADRLHAPASTSTGSACTDKGSIAIGFNGTWTEHLEFEPIPGQGTYDCSGLYGYTCGGPTPAWRHQLRLTYASPWNFTVSGQWRFMSGTELDLNQTNPLFGGGPGSDVADGKIGNYSYFDLSGTWTVKTGLTLRAGINNLFDKDPPVLDSGVTGSGTPNTYNNYDLLGRVVFVGLTANF